MTVPLGFSESPVASQLTSTHTSNACYLGVDLTPQYNNMNDQVFLFWCICGAEASSQMRLRYRVHHTQEWILPVFPLWKNTMRRVMILVIFGHRFHASSEVCFEPPAPIFQLFWPLTSQFKAWVSNMWPANRFSMVCSRTIFVTNILRIGILFLASSIILQQH